MTTSVKFLSNIPVLVHPDPDFVILVLIPDLVRSDHNLGIIIDEVDEGPFLFRLYPELVTGRKHVVHVLISCYTYDVFIVFSVNQPDSRRPTRQS